MGLFSSISKAVSSVATSVKNAGIVVAQSTGVAKLWGDTAKPTVNPTVANIPIVGAAAKALVEHPFISAATVAAPLSSVGKTAATTVAKSVVKSVVANPVKSTVVAAIAAPVIAGTIAKSPTKAVETVITAPSSIANLEENIFTAAKSPSIENFKNIVTENPILSTALIAAVAAPVVKAATIPAILATNNILDNEKIVQPTTTVTPNATTEIPKTPAVVPSINNTAASPVPVTPATTPLLATAGSSTSTRKKYRPKKAVMPSIRQNLNVIVQNRNQNVSISKRERIINKELLYN